MGKVLSRTHCLALPRFANMLITMFIGSDKNYREVIAFPLSNILFFEGISYSTISQILGKINLVSSVFLPSISKITPFIFE